eukprot:SAG31_NODE_11598_length_1014_cov_1.855738_2_plen_97_part_00
MDALCTALTEHFQLIFTVNVYVTPVSSQAFHPHTDPQDVLVLQLEGAKHWTVFHRPIVAPYQNQTIGYPGSIDPTALVGFGGTPEWEGTLQPGDIL